MCLYTIEGCPSGQAFCGAMACVSDLPKGELLTALYSSVEDERAQELQQLSFLTVDSKGWQLRLLCQGCSPLEPIL